MSDENDVDDDDGTYSAIRTVLGTTARTARWHLTDEVDVVTALGRARFDLRQVETTGEPVAEISVKCFLGSVNLVVPPGTLVVLDGSSFLASANCRVEDGTRPDLPRIEVTATTVLGRVRIVSSGPDDAAEPAVAELTIDEVADAAPEPVVAPIPVASDTHAEPDAVVEPEQIAEAEPDPTTEVEAADDTTPVAS